MANGELSSGVFRKLGVLLNELAAATAQQEAALAKVRQEIAVVESRLRVLASGFQEMMEYEDDDHDPMEDDDHDDSEDDRGRYGDTHADSVPDVDEAPEARHYTGDDDSAPDEAGGYGEAAENVFADDPEDEAAEEDASHGMSHHHPGDDSDRLYATAQRQDDADDMEMMEMAEMTEDPAHGDPHNPYDGYHHDGGGAMPDMEDAEEHHDVPDGVPFDRWDMFLNVRYSIHPMDSQLREELIHDYPILQNYL